MLVPATRPALVFCGAKHYKNQGVQGGGRRPRDKLPAMGGRGAMGVWEEDEWKSSPRLHAYTRTAWLEKISTSLEKICDELSEKPLLFQPGSAYEYGPGADVIGLVIEIRKTHAIASRQIVTKIVSGHL